MSRAAAGPIASRARPTISVVIPTWNRAERLARALASVVSQTLPAEEVIVVDDGSTDDTAQRVGREFPQARYLHQPNRGVSAARNRGIGESRGEWIAFLDSDDEWLPEKLERQAAAVAGRPEHDLCHCDEIWIRRGRRVNPKRLHAKAGGRIFRACLPRCVISPSAAMLRRRVFDEIGPFDEELPACEDYDLWLRFCARRPVLFVAEPLVVKHGGREDQLSRRVWGLDRFRVRALEKLLDTEDLEPGDREAACEMLIAKIDLFIAGARKRGRESEIEPLLRLRDRHSRPSEAPARA